MTDRTHTILKLAIGVILSVTFLFLAFRETNPGEWLAIVFGADYFWLLMMIVCLMASHLVRALRWRCFLDPVKRGIGIRNLFSGVMIGYMMNNVLPRAGEVIRPFTIGKLERLPMSAALGTIAVERLLDMLALVSFLAVIPLVYQGPLKEVFPWLHDAGILTAGITAGALAAITAFMVRRDWVECMLRFMRRFVSEKMSLKLERLVHSFLDGFLFLRQPSQVVLVVGLSAVIWGLYLLMVFLAFFAFPTLEELGIDAAFVVLAISSIGVAIPAPGGTGTYHFFTMETLMRLYGVEQNLAVSFATATHAAGFVSVTLLGLYFFLRDHIRMSEVLAAVEKTT